MAAIALLAFRFANGMEIPIEFVIVESSRTSTISYSTGDTATQDTQHDGTMNAVLTFEPQTQRVTAIRFTGGDIKESNYSFRNTADIHFNGQGTKKVVFVQSASGLRMRINTLGDAHPVAYDGMLLEQNRLQSYPTAGTLTASLTIDGQTQTQSIDVATNPPDRIDPAIGTDIRLIVQETLKRAVKVNSRSPTEPPLTQVARKLSQTRIPPSPALLSAPPWP
ncbi:hypothetical protein [Pelagicoccus sp. SDUM812002]|uniref:hypothetical protein n=1 Tax=Pelagicoccus sp. SDUM812002 TaxID=3041266 RepID=UPI00280D959E|nr:hypothetical protein [Pelagicoccus sp. SDUM812002]MDQ8186788.1 hypothetical protein [Pelagicoccus sp. SDUM812002]